MTLNLKVTETSTERLNLVYFKKHDLSYKIFGLLFRVAQIILITPHFNAGTERLHSLVNKSKPLELSSLAIMLVVKLDCPESVKRCIYFVSGTDLSSTSTSVTTNYNWLHLNYRKQTKAAPLVLCVP